MSSWKKKKVEPAGIRFTNIGPTKLSKVNLRIGMCVKWECEGCGREKEGIFQVDEVDIFQFRCDPPCQGALQFDVDSPLPIRGSYERNA